MSEDSDNTETMSQERQKPLQFSLYGFKPHAWERERIHRYSVNRPLWWKMWLRIREMGTHLGIS